MHVVIFEGHRWPSYAPLSLSRPVFMLRCGLGTLLEQSIRCLKPTRLTLWVRPGLAEYCRQHVAPNLPVPCKVNEPLDHEPALLSSGRCIHLQSYEVPSGPSVVLDEGNLVRKALVHAPGLSPDDCLRRTDAWMKLSDLPQAPPESRLPQYVWDIAQWNDEIIVADTIEMRGEATDHPAGPYHLVHKEDVHLAANVSIEPGVVLDASKGPVVIDAGVTLGANSVLQGPCHVGAYTAISALTYIRGGTSIGTGCKIGGEVASSIIMSYSNKVHYGYLGDSYLGEWVNLGAGTTTSNLKNTYGPISVRIGPQQIATDRRFLGSMIGDHSKTAIGTRLMTGSYVGYCCLVAGSDLPPKYLPSFTFWTDKGSEKYRMEKAREVMTQVLGRRGKPWTEQDQAMVEYVAQTASEVEEG
jgi:UDP-N-acetylglucosamine diphosphorylase / glucose-1-phosphate thymidylyltransferase / UDP-N-acetylgalactosamine diphosphorylase / glucosamine-1-phosphate N-acetyltransferase / galactosamine-1-phosphate N-acetyltransferase